MKNTKHQHVFEVTLVCGNAEGCALVAAVSKAEAKRLASESAARKSFCWEGDKGNGKIEIVSVVDKGRDVQ
jgi:hypothetical protein